MSITTRTGDEGSSRMPADTWLPKHAPRLEALGHLDELDCVLGLARAETDAPEARELITLAQGTLRAAAAEVACAPETLGAGRHYVTPGDVAALDAFCQHLEQVIEMPRGFVSPGATRAAATVDLARAVTRRCERRLSALRADDQTAAAPLQAWINRLSDALWLLARHLEQRPAAP